jgi:hypothetical protein
VQLRDAHGNAVPLAGVPVKLRLKAAAAGGGAPPGGAAPELHVEAGAAEAETDERGRAFFGDVLVEAGTGRVVRARVRRVGVYHAADASPGRALFASGKRPAHCTALHCTAHTRFFRPEPRPPACSPSAPAPCLDAPDNRSRAAPKVASRASSA